VFQCADFISRVYSSQWLVSQWHTRSNAALVKIDRASRGETGTVIITKNNDKGLVCDLHRPRLRRQIGIFFLSITPKVMIYSRLYNAGGHQHNGRA
jgi:hypothetical protein